MKVFLTKSFFSNGIVGPVPAEKISDTQVRLPDGKIYQVPHWHPDWYAAKAHAGHLLDAKMRSLAKQLEMAEKCGGATANLRKALAKWRALDNFGWFQDRLSITSVNGYLGVVDNQLGNLWLINTVAREMGQRINRQESIDWCGSLNKNHHPGGYELPSRADIEQVMLTDRYHAVWQQLLPHAVLYMAKGENLVYDIDGNKFKDLGGATACNAVVVINKTIIKDRALAMV